MAVTFGGNRTSHGFFGRRLPLDLGQGGFDDEPDPGYRGYVNLPQIVGTVISAGRATLHEMQTVYSLEDAYNLLEIVQIDDYNASLARKVAEAKAEAE